MGKTFYRAIAATCGITTTVFFLAACGDKTSDDAPQESAAIATAPDAAFLFDDFDYDTVETFAANGWRIRTETGHPGVQGATWSAKGLSFHAAGQDARNGIIRMASHTDGTAENTQHTQFCHERKYFRGTYAARVRFRDLPSAGPDGDEVIQTFYAISPLEAPMALNYSEMDFEYLPNGGWDESHNALWATTWETFQLEPWTKVNEFTTLVGSFDGWHTLVLHADEKEVRYFVDGELFASHSDAVAPEEPMSINFNMWFTQEGLIQSSEHRQYQEDVDWVYHEVDNILSTEEVEQRVSDLRDQNLQFQDSVPPWSPELPSPCGL